MLKIYLINIFIIIINLFLFIMYYLLYPIRLLWTQFLNWVFIQHIPNSKKVSFMKSNIKEFCDACISGYVYLNRGDILDITDEETEKWYNKLFKQKLPDLREKGWLPKWFTHNVLVRIIFGYLTIPLAWWLVDEMYCELLDKDTEEVKFYVPKCKFLVESKKIYGHERACTHECQYGTQELIRRLTGGLDYKVEPNLDNDSCVFTIASRDLLDW